MDNIFATYLKNEVYLEDEKNHLIFSFNDELQDFQIYKVFFFFFFFFKK